MNAVPLFGHLADAALDSLISSVLLCTYCSQDIANT